MKLFKSKFISGIYWLMCSFSFSSAMPVQAESPDDLVVIVNHKFAGTELSATEVRRIFKKEMTTFMGNRVKPIHAKTGTSLRQEFISKALGINLAAEQKYWQDMAVKKGMSPPIELSNTVRGVFSAPGAISYCYRKDFNPATARIVLEF
ncbi:MAG: hypothetical protein JXR76_06855 [Deltaproteobacteria bacterium]|nr:hypothetical protein [Deltaproteobacteria bacterium]